MILILVDWVEVSTPATSLACIVSLSYYPCYGARHIVYSLNHLNCSILDSSFILVELDRTESKGWPWRR